MRGLVSILLVAGSAAALAGMAHAQPGWGGPRAILFDQPNYQGRSITVVEGAPDLANWGFAARAMSARFEGDWTVCDAPNLDGRCATVSGDVADLGQVGLRRIVSLGDGATDGAQSDGHREAAAAMTDNSARAGQQAATAPEDEQVPGARIGAQRPSFNTPPPAPPSASGPPIDPGPSATARVVAGAPPLPTTLAAPPAPSAPSSAEAPRAQLVAYAGPPAAGPPAAGVPQAGQSDAGHSAVFFAKPLHGGAEVAVDAQGPANQFCHEQGLGSAVYFDTDGHVLRDVLCRRP